MPDIYAQAVSQMIFSSPMIFSLRPLRQTAGWICSTDVFATVRPGNVLRSTYPVFVPS
jgi:hypothetical protein